MIYNEIKVANKNFLAKNIEGEITITQITPYNSTERSWAISNDGGESFRIFYKGKFIRQVVLGKNYFEDFSLDAAEKICNKLNKIICLFLLKTDKMLKIK